MANGTMSDPARARKHLSLVGVSTAMLLVSGALGGISVLHSLPSVTGIRVVAGLLFLVGITTFLRVMRSLAEFVDRVQAQPGS